MEYDKSIVNRLKRIEGKIKGVLNMIEQNKECRDVITSASRNANDRAIGLIASKNLEQCVRWNMDGESTEELVKEAVDLLVKSR